MMYARRSQIILDEDELESGEFSKNGSKSAQTSNFSAVTSASTYRSQYNSIHKNDVRKIEQDRKEQNEVGSFALCIFALKFFVFLFNVKYENWYK